MEEPLQGRCAGGGDLVQTWISTEIWHGLAVVGRLSRVKEIKTVDTWANRYAGGTSRLMMAKVIWRLPIAGEDSQLVIVGHLHNELAKVPKSPHLKDFWDRLAHLCVGGGRVIGMDANMAVFGVMPELAKRGVGLTLLAHHMEVKHLSSTRGMSSSGTQWACGSSDRSTSSAPTTSQLPTTSFVGSPTPNATTSTATTTNVATRKQV